MQKNISQKKYSLSMRILHWVMAAIMLTLLGVGLWMTSLPNDYPGKYDIYALHKSFGVVALILIVTRLIVRFNTKIPKLPSAINKWEARLSDIVLVLLYICMVLQPLSGYVMSDLTGHKVAFFSLSIPLIFPKDQQLGMLFVKLHTIIGYGLIALFVLHLAGAIKHLLVERINLFRRMW